MGLNVGPSSTGCRTLCVATHLRNGERLLIPIYIFNTIWLIPFFNIDSKNKIVQQFDPSRGLDLSINVIFCLYVHANPTTIQL